MEFSYIFHEIKGFSIKCQQKLSKQNDASETLKLNRFISKIEAISFEIKKKTNKILLATKFKYALLVLLRTSKIAKCFSQVVAFKCAFV